MHVSSLELGLDTWSSTFLNKEMNLLSLSKRADLCWEDSIKPFTESWQLRETGDLLPFLGALMPEKYNFTIWITKEKDQKSQLRKMT